MVHEQPNFNTNALALSEPKRNRGFRLKTKTVVSAIAHVFFHSIPLEVFTIHYCQTEKLHDMIMIFFSIEGNRLWNKLWNLSLI